MRGITPQGKNHNYKLDALQKRGALPKCNQAFSKPGIAYARHAIISYNHEPRQHDFATFAGAVLRVRKGDSSCEALNPRSSQA